MKNKTISAFFFLAISSIFLIGCAGTAEIQSNNQATNESEVFEELKSPEDMISPEESEVIKDSEGIEELESNDGSEVIEESESIEDSEVLAESLETNDLILNPNLELVIEKLPLFAKNGETIRFGDDTYRTSWRTSMDVYIKITSQHTWKIDKDIFEETVAFYYPDATDLIINENAAPVDGYPTMRADFISPGSMNIPLFTHVFLYIITDEAHFMFDLGYNTELATEYKDLVESWIDSLYVKDITK